MQVGGTAKAPGVPDTRGTVGGGAGKDSQKGTREDNKARVAQRHSEYRDQVALAPETSEH